jgi:hypothetical protein
MDRNSFLSNLEACADTIDTGRKGLATNGKEHKGRLFYEKGIAGAMVSFQEANAARDVQILVEAEQVFRQQELEFCDGADVSTRSSLTAALRGCEDSLRSLEVVKNAVFYKEAEKTHPTRPDLRIEGCPRDAFHQACISNIARLRNACKVPGINMLEKALFTQRIDNMSAAQEAYLELQKTALAGI